MSYNPNRHHRKSIRLPKYDYSQAGSYFITICSHNRQNILGVVYGDAVQLNQLGIIVKDSWLWLEKQYHHVKLDQFIVMPDHFHGIITIQEYCRGDSRIAQLKSIGRIIGAFKTISSKKVNQFRETPGSLLWQRNYWERIIRTEYELNAVRHYIINNPANWSHAE